MASAVENTRQASNSKPFEVAARVGYAVDGLLHMAIGTIAWHIALGGSGEADAGGAIGRLVMQPFGVLLVWVGFAGCAMLSLWHLSEVVFQGRGRDSRNQRKDRWIAAGRTIIYAGLAMALAQFVLGGSTDSGEATSDFSATLMASPGGSALLLVIGAGIIGIGGYFIFKGLSGRFRRDLRTTGPHHIGKLTVFLGVAGHTAKGAALGAVGLLFIVATVQHDPEESTGMDGALKALGAQPFGVVILAAIGLGLICFGIYSLARAKFAKMKGGPNSG
ncbi:MAG TPA: DUF1206 domain-containing protein [Arthrobacter sp.]|nr:DUF1206 domain-containing protein [Arthrobacter sp.]